MFQTIKAKFIIKHGVSILSLIIILIVSYFLAVSNIKKIMVNDVSTVAKTLGGIVEFIVSNHKDGYEEKSFKEVVHKMKVEKIGYVYLCDNRRRETCSI